MSKVVVVSFLLSALLLVGCTSTNREGLLAAGYAPEYVDGYVDGYSAGCHAIGHPFYKFTKDTSRFEEDQRYKRGWEDGFTIARCDYAAIW
jgi:hypothetical protein